MKKLFPFLLLIFGSAQAQITFENTYPFGAASANDLGVIHLTSSGYKYMEADSDHITIYNLNHTLFRNILIPVNNVDPSYFVVQFVSEELFNTNPNDIEYIVKYRDNFGSVAYLRVFDENGNVLFSRDSMLLGVVLGSGYQQSGISYTPNGVKMIISHQFGGSAEVFGLPGILPCSECTSGVISGFVPSQSNNGNPQQFLPDPYPNPTNNSVTVSYQFPPGVNTGQLVFYDMMGQEVRRFTVTNSFTSMLISKEDLAPGTYFYNLETSKGIVSGKKVVVTE